MKGPWSRPRTFKRFILFEYDSYYPSGGMSDCSNSFETLDEAVNDGKLSKSDWVEIFDCTKRQLVWERRGQDGKYL